MKHSLSLATVVCLASLAGCAALPEDAVDRVAQSAIVGPGQDPSPAPPPSPNACTSGVADATFTLPAPLLSPAYPTERGASAPGGLYGCDYHVVEFRNVDTLRQYTGFNGVAASTSSYPDMTQADCEASIFSGWASTYHPPVGGAAGWWETIESEGARYGVWLGNAQGGGSCMWDPYQSDLHYFSASVLSGVTRMRLGSRLKVRHGGVWSRHPVRTDGRFLPPAQ